MQTWCSQAWEASDHEAGKIPAKTGPKTRGTKAQTKAQPSLLQANRKSNNKLRNWTWQVGTERQPIHIFVIGYLRFRQCCSRRPNRRTFSHRCSGCDESVRICQRLGSSYQTLILIIWAHGGSMTSLSTRSTTSYPPRCPQLSPERVDWTEKRPNSWSNTGRLSKGQSSTQLSPRYPGYSPSRSHTCLHAWRQNEL